VLGVVGEASAMMSLSGLSLETATRRMGLLIECVVVVWVMRELTEVRAERSWVVRVGVGFIAEGIGGEVVCWEDMAGIGVWVVEVLISWRCWT